MEKNKITATVLSEKFKQLEDVFGLEQKKGELEKLSARSLDPDLWKDSSGAGFLMEQIGDLKKEISEFENLKEEISALGTLEKENPDADLDADLQKAARALDRLQLETFFTGPYDFRNAVVSIHSGQGGTEAMDWAEMLFRMYMRFCEKKGFKTETLDYGRGEEAGIKSATFSVEGKNAYGLFKAESGTHRLVRQSPFNADKLRQTSFALVEVLPQLEELDAPDVEINEKDLEWQFFRASSQGGQNVQKVSTAVRLRHIPSGIVVTAQAERFQQQNRKIASSLLRAKLWQKAREKLAGEKKEIKGEYKPASWGTQIRSYVLHPYKMVKDLRTGVESSNPEAVLDGDLDEFIEAGLKADQEVK